VALNANALTTLALAKSYLKIPALEPSQDAMIELFINSASALLESECDRVLKQQTGIVEYQDGRKQNIIVLKQYPVTAVSEVRIDQDSVFTDPATLIPPADYAITDDGNALLYINGQFASGNRSVKITYTAGYATVPSDLEHACLWLVFWYAKIRDAADIGRSTKNKEGESISYSQSAPQDVKDAILRYKRTECLAGNASIFNG
jgi:uncharacterized phiE125 gp8 family phage protein